MSVAAVLLDVDGTLVLSNDEHAAAWERALSEHGFPVAYERIRPLIGMGGDKILPQLTSLTEDSVAGKAIAKRRMEIFSQDYAPGIKAAPGARELVLELRSRGIARVLATSADPKEVEMLLTRANLNGLIDDAATSGDAEESKPEPDIVAAALKKAGAAAPEAVLLGDTKYDIEAARRAGLRTVALRCGGSSDGDLAGASAIYDDPADLLKNLDQSPICVSPRA